MKKKIPLVLVAVFVVFAAWGAKAIGPGVLDVARLVAAAATAAPLKSADTIAARSSPATGAQHSTKNLATSTTTASAHVTEPEEFSKRLAQQFRVRNLDTSIAVCFTVSTRASSSESCSAECAAIAAGSLTCEATAATTTGAYLPGEAVYTNTITGEDCLCVESASGAPVINIEQINRYP